MAETNSLNKYYVVPPNTNNVHSAYLVSPTDARTHAIKPRDDATSFAAMTQQGHRRSTMTLTISQNTPQNNSTSPNDVEFTNKRAFNTSLNSQMRVASTLHEVCRPLLPAELGTRETAPSYIAGQTRAAHKTT